MSETGTVKCRYCGRLHRVENGRLCEHCGIVAVLPLPEPEPEIPPRRCLKCGVPAASDATRCRSCGNPMPEPDAEEPGPPPLSEGEDSRRELELVDAPPVQLADGPVKMAPVEESSRDVDLPPGPPDEPVELAKEPVRMDPPHYREVEIK